VIEALASLGLGLGVGLLVSAPVGPVALLAIRRSLSDDRAGAVATGLGAALADVGVAAVAVLGAAALEASLQRFQAILMLAGGAALLIAGLSGLGWKGLQAVRERNVPGPGSLAANLAQGFLITLGNPANAAGVSVIAAAALIDHQGSGLDGLAFAGFGLGAVLWWTILAIGVHRGRGIVGDALLRRINTALSGLVALAGLVVIVSALAGLIASGAQGR
jgi:putative LysE/RhtB family amino acid efflux pump